MTAEKQIRLLAEAMPEWQTPYGRPDPKTCPFIVTENLVNSMNFHSPTFMAIGLYAAYEATGEIRYKEAADRYVVGYFACLRNPPLQPDFYTQTWTEYVKDKGELTSELRRWAINILTWPFIYGMALAGYADFKKHNPEEPVLDAVAAATYEWLQFWRWEEGSYYRNGYGSLRRGIIDSGNSDDNCHMGRGLMGYHGVTGRDEVLGDAEGLARYYLTECEPGTYNGCWSSELGTWVIAPTIDSEFEHLTDVKSYEAGWGFSSLGSIEYLTELAKVTKDPEMRAGIGEKCVASMKWHFDACQFDDGALGMSKKDDKWLGMTAGAIMSYLRVRDGGFLSDADAAEYGDKARAGRDWLLEHVTPEGIECGGYFKVTGQSEPRPVDNLAWQFGLALQGLCMLEEL